MGFTLRTLEVRMIQQVESKKFYCCLTHEMSGFSETNGTIYDDHADAVSACVNLMRNKPEYGELRVALCDIVVKEYCYPGRKEPTEA